MLSHRPIGPDAVDAPREEANNALSGDVSAKRRAPVACWLCDTCHRKLPAPAACPPEENVEFGLDLLMLVCIAVLFGGTTIYAYWLLMVDARVAVDTSR
jgi:hypothetical protein